jgi:hypothetical protein
MERPVLDDEDGGLSMLLQIDPKTESLPNLEHVPKQRRRPNYPNDHICEAPLPRCNTDTMPSPRPSSISLKPIQQIMLSHNSIATRNALSGLKSSYHLFLRNQPTAPEQLKRKAIPRRLRRDWEAPRVDY